MINTPYKELEPGHRQIHPALQFLIFIGVFIGALIIGTMVGAGIVTALYGINTLTAVGNLSVTSPHFLNSLWILQITGTTLPLLAAPVFFSYVITGEPLDYMKPTFRFPWMLIPLVLLIMLISNPTIEVLSNINQKMQLPHFLSGVQKWMEESENSAQKLTDTMLQMKNIGDLVLNVLLIGLATAIVEEFMFRGVLQTIFLRWTKSTHAAIWITAILFSAFHMEFFGFLPRLMLGLLFGYFVVWSGSIWPAVWAHFLNNGTAVIATYLFQHKIIKVNPGDQHLFSVGSYIFSVVIMVFLLFLYRKTALEHPQITKD